MSAAQPLDAAPTNVRWPLFPLLDAAGLTRTALARRLRVSGQLVTDAASAGVSDTLADQWATRLGLHPVDVWGWDWVETGLSPERINGRPPLDRLTDHLRDQIDRGDLAPGDPMPTARSLAVEWCVGRTTANRAIAALRAEGRITGGGHGQLAYVAERPTHDCAVCGARITPGNEHYPPADDRQRQAVHPNCCPCSQGVAR